MDTRIIPPVYFQIALDIAQRISKGELKESTKIQGRSLMASQYGVSPETIRRSMKLLEDMQIVHVKQNSGVIILSADNAAQYVEKFSSYNDIRTRQKYLKELLAEQNKISEKIAEEAEAIIRINEKFSKSSPFKNYELDVPDTSPLLGKTLGELMFWQQTGATVIAIRRDEHIILSPGPYALIEAGDTLVFIGEIKCVEIVQAFINGR